MRRLLALTMLFAALPGAADAASPRAKDVVARCSPFTPPDGVFAADERRDLRDIAVCALAAARRAASRRSSTRQDRALGRAARSGLALAVALERDTESARRRVTRRVSDRYRCRRRERVAVQVADSSPDGGAATPREVVETVLRATRTSTGRRLLSRRARISVQTRSGEVLAGKRSGAIALIVAGATCG